MADYDPFESADDDPSLRIALASTTQPPLTPQDHPLMDLIGADGQPAQGIVHQWEDDQPADPFKDEAKRILSDDYRRRLQRTEQEVAVMTQAEREAVADWLGSMLHRPPLDRPTRAWVAMRAIVEALWWDLADRTPADATDPDAGNPRLDANHPWGEGSEA